MSAVPRPLHVQTVFRVGHLHHVEPALNSVTGPAGAIRLEPKVMQVLVCLAEHAPNVVAKEQLIRTVWSDTFVTDDVLTRSISELRRVFGDDAREPRFIETIPKSGYRLVAPVVAPSVAVQTGRWKIGVILGLLGLFAVTLIPLWQLRKAPISPVPPMRIVPLTALNGSEYGGTFSPDGRQLAFAWNGELPPGESVRTWVQGNWDIYVKLVGGVEVRRLTTDPGLDLAPVWSPDGRQIAYVRLSPHGQQVRVMSALGGGDRAVSDFPAFLPATWSPDSRYLAAGRDGPVDATHANGIHLIPLDGGEPRAITRPEGTRADQSAIFSPDGHRLAYASCDEFRVECVVKVAELDSSFAVIGQPRTLTGLLGIGKSGLTWTRDGRFVVFNAELNQFSYLWRVPSDGNQPAERIEIAGVNALFPSASLADDRLAFTRLFHDEDIYCQGATGTAKPVARSSLFDGTPQYSPDGKHIAFGSLRSGAMEVWIANADGSAPEQLTRGLGPFQGDPAWSPDGRRVAFESQAADGHPHVWTIANDGSTPRQITKDPGDQMGPSWSRDGRWIYYSWLQGADRDIWRVRTSGSPPERVTTGGGFVAQESPDGTALFYLSKSEDSPLMTQPINGGTARRVVDCVIGTAFAVTRSGIYYVPCFVGPFDPNPVVRRRDFATGTERELGRLTNFQYNTLPSGFAVSPDGLSILYGRLVRDEADLMMIENFR
jgi:Tol biopolymer transport system component/DNA-binding winged helix-turn-helix (wHTH) protein